MHWPSKGLSKSILRPTYNLSKRAFHTSPITWSEQFKILFMGRDEFSCLVLQELHVQRSDVWQEIHLATNPDEKVDRGSRLSVSPLKILGHKLELPVHTIPRSKPEFNHWKASFLQLPPPFSDVHDDISSPRHLMITASFGRILPLKMLKLFAPDRRLNVHPSLLPAYRGAAPIQHAILNDEKETGVCVLSMLQRAKGIDAGPIWGTRKMPMPENVVFSELRDKLAVEGGQLLVSVLRDMLDDRAFSTPQAQNDDFLASTISFRDAILDFTTMSAETIVRTHRAISHQRPLTAYLRSIKALQIHSPSVHNSPPPFTPTAPGRACFSKPDKAILIRCAQDTVLSVPQVKQEGKALLDAGAWWSGAKSLGLVSSNQIGFDSEEDIDDMFLNIG
ncbi:formyl transferase [Rhodocollybia butyracea]|uniref:methionyl-tRNA formyltransferase n=1 Tax=Rhodocollybia butyracea TaxID=206335 RepID=A0A9P5UEK8_9AGAR|nr:formyl transferase [Rhodocollybia butyracea]